MLALMVRGVSGSTMIDALTFDLMNELIKWNQGWPLRMQRSLDVVLGMGGDANAFHRHISSIHRYI